MRRRRIVLAGSVAVAALAAAAVEAVVRTGLVKAEYFPAPTTVVADLAALLTRAETWGAIRLTLQGWAVGMLIAIALGVCLGTLIGLNPYADRASRVLVEFLRPVPAVALIPLAILVFGSGFGSKVFLAAFGAVWPILIQSIYGARDLDSAQRDTMTVFRLRPVDRLLSVRAWNAMPSIATGVRIAAGTALVLVVSAELIIGSPGMGREVVTAQYALRPERMYAWILAIGLLGWGLNSGLFAIERRALRWHPSYRAAQS